MFVCVCVCVSVFQTVGCILTLDLPILTRFVLNILLLVKFSVCMRLVCILQTVWFVFRLDRGLVNMVCSNSLPFKTCHHNVSFVVKNAPIMEILLLQPIE